MLCNPPACRASIERCCSKSHLGGLAGADGHCQSLAAAAGSGNRTWRAYLSTARRPGGTVVDARDRIGAGPWFNAEGVPIAQNVEELHGENNLNKETALDELGALVNGRGDSPNRHDILTGSQLDGTAFTEGEELTCDDWNSSGDGSASWDITTGRGAAPIQLRGTQLTGPVVAARAICSVPVATVSSIFLRPIRQQR